MVVFDLAAPNNPVILTRAGGHSAVTNSLALDLAGVTLETPQPGGGVIERDDNGELNGIIRERQEIVGRLVPESTYAEIIASLEINLNDLLRLGITSITDASKPPNQFAMWEELYKNALLPLPRSQIQFQWFDIKGINEVKARAGNGTDLDL